MNVLKRSIAAFIASQGKTAAAGLKLRHDLQEVYLPEAGVGEILRDVYGEEATRRSHEAQYNAIHYAWAAIGDDGKRKPRQPKNGAEPAQPENGAEPAQPKNGAKPAQPKNGAKPAQPKNGAKPAQPKNGAKLAQLVKLPVNELAAWIRSIYSLTEMRALKAEL